MGRSVECLVDSSGLVVRSADGVERVLGYGHHVLLLVGSRLWGGDGGNPCRGELVRDISRF